ncbi:alcohol dehydrogenase (plasmid) [Rhodococcus erythropolis]|uniref:NAD(P)-dependent alcohol dehydrogenase n=1 Tax=Rhodococcus erythropolis TaxID=1833 RepID=UPI00061B70AD|nr:NAD(P)-dependent alcohol dehydrogenase [Rhodococcus erythropolis]AKE01513.1 alcohol dehydrogenase [Rhodococcus erythropolis]
MKIKAAVLNKANAPLDIEELQTADLRADEILVKLAGTGVCHTDLGVIAAPGEGQTPIVLGHEGAGTVIEIGSGVDTLAVGDRVVLSYAHCGRCDNCTSGIPQHCRDFGALNLVGARVDGSTPLSREDQPVLGAWFGQSSWADHAVVTAHNAVKVDDDLPLELLGPLGCGIQTGAGAVLNTLNPEQGSSIAIFGVGSVGLAALLGAVVAECTTIIAVDINDSRLQKALELGATHIVNSSNVDAVETIREITGGAGVHYSVDCIGFPAVVRSALECLQTPGVCASVGFQGIPNEITIDQGLLLFGKALVGVIEGDAIPSEFIPRMIGLYKEGRFPFDKLIDTFAFTDINTAIDAAHHGTVTKAVVVFEAAESAHV